MKKRLFVAAAAFASITIVMPAYAALDPESAETQMQAVRAERPLDFCAARPELLRGELSSRDRALCPLASALTDCPGFAQACAVPLTPSDAPSSHFGWLARLVEALARFASVAQYAVWAILAAIFVLFVRAIVLAMLRLRREVTPASALLDAKISMRTDDIRQVADAPIPLDDLAALLARAERLRSEGQLDSALAAYLEATLLGLERAGLIERAKHRTHGEYVRACRQPEARAALADIARAVDASTFGHHPTTPETVDRVGRTVTTIFARLSVPIVALTTLFAAFIAVSIAGCGEGPALDHPHGDELVRGLLRRQGVALVDGGPSLGDLPIAAEKREKAAWRDEPVLLLDGADVTLDDDARDHFEAWVRAGGRAILLGSGRWPVSFGMQRLEAEGHAVHVRETLSDEGDNGDNGDSAAPIMSTAHAPYDVDVVTADAVQLEGGRTVADIAGDHDAKVGAEPATPSVAHAYAAYAWFGRGEVLALANGDLLTNAALLRPGTSRVLVKLLSRMPMARLRIVRPEDGASPAGDPISALVRAGLGPTLAQTSFALGLLFAAFGIAASKRLPLRSRARRAFAEHVQAIGALYARRRLGRHALASYLRYVEARLRECSTSSTEPPATILARRADRSVDECSAIWARAEALAADDRSTPNSAIVAMRALVQLVAEARLTEHASRT